ncbi:MAG: eCIS core domain-containing protein [Acidimicrobiia bacterium]
MAGDGPEARIVRVPAFLPGYAAITIGRYIFVRRDLAHDRQLIDHELVHVRQWHEHGAFHFVTRYVGSYLRNRRHGMGHWAAYRAIPYEREARRIAGR